jgi:hypothetical protein
LMGDPSCIRRLQNWAVGARGWTEIGHAFCRFCVNSRNDMVVIGAGPAGEAATERR